MKYRHYAPKAPVTVVTGSPQRSAAYILGRVQSGDGVICFDEFASLFGSCTVQRLGGAADKAAQAQRVFDALRAFDETNVGRIYAQCPDESGLGLAVSNRLKKAAGFCVEDAGDGIIFGITGGTGAGKTSALLALETLGGYILDCDALYHEMLRTDEPLRNALTDAFGDVFCPDGTLDRQKLGNVVFRDEAAMAQLNAIVYAHLVPEAARRAVGHDIVGFDAINVIESGMSLMCCRTVGITAPAETRVKRIMARDGIDETYARMRIAAQKSDAFYYEHCTDVLENTEESPEAFTKKALDFFTKLIKEENSK
jgi:L-threonylcarbamoyladenylate synthase